MKAVAVDKEWIGNVYHFWICLHWFLFSSRLGVTFFCFFPFCFFACFAILYCVSQFNCKIIKALQYLSFLQRTQKLRTSFITGDTFDPVEVFFWLSLGRPSSVQPSFADCSPVVAFQRPEGKPWCSPGSLLSASAQLPSFLVLTLWVLIESPPGCLQLGAEEELTRALLANP